MTMEFPSSMEARDTQLFQVLNGVRYLAESHRFKAWLIDQYGVLHDGKQPYPNAISTVQMLAKSGAKMVIISNSSRRASTTMEKLKSLGFDTSFFLGAITSGELTHNYLQRRDDEWFAALGKSCIHITWIDEGAISLEGLKLQVVQNVEEAEFVLVHGTEAIGQSSGPPHPLPMEELEKILKKCAAKKIPMLVANPDFVTVQAKHLLIMPGTIGANFEKLGGQVKWMGKPNEIIYNAAMEMCGFGHADTIVVGDSLYHDIKGANNVGIDSVFITGGIHLEEIGLNYSREGGDISIVRALASKYLAYPSYVLPTFAWQNQC